jgi:hypothetical protein
MVDVYSTEPERQAALQELTALRRELKTETAKGAKAAQSDPRFIAAQARLDAAKSSVGMRTSAQDLAALNKIATSNTATMRKTATGAMKAAPTKAEREVTKQLNAPSRQYFEGPVREAYNNPDRVPNWQANSAFGRTGKGLIQQDIDFAKIYDVDLSSARYDWVWSQPKDEQGNPIADEPGSWRIGIIGAKKIAKPKEAYVDSSGNFGEGEYITDQFASDSITLGQWAEAGGGTFGAPAIVQFTKGKPDKRQEMLLNQTRAEFYKAFNPFQGMLNAEKINEVVQAVPELKYTEMQEILYQLALEKDNDITIQDILNKYEELYGEG